MAGLDGAAVGLGARQGGLEWNGVNGEQRLPSAHGRTSV
jgi:hypothetical protein